MTDKSLSLSVLGSAALISASIVWHGTRSPSHGSSAAPMGTVMAESAATSPSAAQPSPPTPPSGQELSPYPVTFDLFDLAWRSGPAADALDKCWKPLDAKYGAALVDRMPQFMLSVDATGKVTKVEPALLHEEKHQAKSELGQCLVKIIQPMKLRPSGRAGSGRVQASRPEG